VEIVAGPSAQAQHLVDDRGNLELAHHHVGHAKAAGVEPIQGDAGGLLAVRSHPHHPHQPRLGRRQRHDEEGDEGRRPTGSLEDVFCAVR
jgi:hypothetical protein